MESGHADNVKDCNGPFRCALRGLDRENFNEFSENATDENVIEANSDILSRVERARRVTNFPDKTGRGRDSSLPSEDIKRNTRLGSQVELYRGFGGLRL